MKTASSRMTLLVVGDESYL